MLLGDELPAAPAPCAVGRCEGGRPPRWHATSSSTRGDVPPAPVAGRAQRRGRRARRRRRAQLQVLPRTGLLREDPEPGFVLDPVVLDCAGQVVGFWAAEMLEQAQVVFPFRLAALDLYGPAAAGGRAALLPCGDHAARASSVVSSDIDVLDADGRCRMRLHRLGGQALRRARALRAAGAPRAAGADVEPWSGAAGALPPGTRVACRRLDARLPADRRAVEAACGRAACSVAASASCSRALDAARAPGSSSGSRRAPRPRSAWPSSLADAHGLELLPAEIEILPDERGAPVVVSSPALEGARRAAGRLARAHARPRGGARGAPTRRAHGVGIDIELLVPRPRGVRRGGVHRGGAAPARAAARGRRRGVAAAPLVRARGRRARRSARVSQAAPARRARRRSTCGARRVLIDVGRGRRLTRLDASRAAS